jgi:hypothetical protein
MTGDFKRGRKRAFIKAMKGKEDSIINILLRVVFYNGVGSETEP